MTDTEHKFIEEYTGGRKYVVFSPAPASFNGLGAGTPTILKQNCDMITPTTQAAIAVLKDIYTSTSVNGNCTGLPPETLEEVLGKLQKRGLICLAGKGDPRLITSYHPAERLKEISLLDILEATGEHLNCNHPTTEELYMHYGRAAPKLGVVNHMTRLYLEDIKLFDL